MFILCDPPELAIPGGSRRPRALDRKLTGVREARRLPRAGHPIAPGARPLGQTPCPCPTAGREGRTQRRWAVGPQCTGAGLPKRGRRSRAGARVGPSPRGPPRSRALLPGLWAPPCAGRKQETLPALCECSDLLRGLRPILKSQSLKARGPNPRIVAWLNLNRPVKVLRPESLGLIFNMKTCI